MTLPANLERKFGNSTVKAQRCGSRYFVDSFLLWECNGPDAVLFADALDHLEEVSGWNSNGGQSSLKGALCSDWEPAHIFVALNLNGLADYAQGKDGFFRNAGELLWYVMRLETYSG